MPVDCRLRFGARPSSRIKRVPRDVSVTTYADFFDPLTGRAVDVSGVACRVWLPGGALLSPALTPTEIRAGHWSVDVTPAYSDPVQPYRVEVSCTTPDSASATIDFYVYASEPDAGTPPTPQPVTSVNGQTGAVVISVGTEGAVTSVNGVEPDEDGAATVTAAEIDWTPPGTSGVARKASVEFSSRPPLPEHKGAVGDGVANDHAAVQAWLDEAAAAEVRVVENGRGIYNLGSNGLVVPRNLTIKGDFNPGAARFDRRFNNMPGTFVHDGTNPIFLRFGAKLEGCCVVGSDLFSRGEIDSASKLLATRHAWSGTGVQMGSVTGQQNNNGTDAEVTNVFSVGFDRCIASINASRTTIQGCRAEGRDAFYIQGSFDFGWMINCGAPMVVGGFTSFAGRWFVVTGAANNGSGAIRLTVTPNASGLAMTDMADDYYVRVAEVGGVPNATGIWQVEVIDSTHLDLIGSTWGGAYTSGGRCFPQLNWSRGTAFSVIDTDGYVVAGCQSNNYTVAHRVDRTVASFIGCNSEGYNFPLPGVHMGFKSEATHGNIIWTGGSLGAFTNKIWNRCTGRVVFTGTYWPSSGSSGATVEQHGGRMFINAGLIAGRVNVGDGSKRLALFGGSEGAPSITGTPAGLSTVAMMGTTEAGQGVLRMRGIRTQFHARHLTNGSERLALDLDYDRLRLFNDAEVWAGRGSPEGVVPGRRGSLFLKGDATAAQPAAIKLTSSSTKSGWAWLVAVPIPPVLDTAVAALLDYASGGEGIVAGGTLHADAVFTRSHNAGDLVATADSDSIWTEVGAHVPRFFGPDRRLVIEGDPVENLLPGSRCLGAVEGEEDGDSTPPTGWSVSYPGGLTPRWSYDTIDGITGVKLLLTGTTTAAAPIIINSSGNTVALGAIPTALNDTRAASAITKVVDDDAAVTTLTCGLQFLTTTGGSASGASASWHADRATLAQRGGTATAANASTGGARVRITSNTIATDTTMTWSLFMADMMVAASASVDLPALPPAGTAATAGHSGEALEVAASDISLDSDGECSVYMACIARRASLAGTDQVLLRIGSATDCARAIIAAGSSTLQMQRVVGGTPGAAVTLATITPGTEFGFVLSLAADGTLSGALADAGSTLQSQSGAAITGVADVHVGIASVIEVRTLYIRDGLPS